MAISFVQPIVDRYNENVPIPSLRVSWDHKEKGVLALYKRLNRLSSRGLISSLVYSPRDLSVYVRTELSDGMTVDVALCNQDRTHRSKLRLNDNIVKDCDNRVGPFDARERLPRVETLDRVVRDFIEERLVHSIRSFVPNFCTVELARSYNQEREATAVKVSASEIWGERGHERIHFDFERASQDRDIFAAWLICMTLFERETTPTEQKQMQEFLLRSNKEFDARCMTTNVNYEAMFRCRSDEFRDGRLSWPIVLALCLSKNKKKEFRDIKLNTSQARRLGTYKGMLTPTHYLCMVWAMICFAGMTATVAVGFKKKWENEMLGWLIPLLVVFCGGSISFVNYCWLHDASLWAFLLPDASIVPEGDNLNRDMAIRLLMSPSCRKCYSESNLGFTGEAFEGNLEFGYQFTYTDLIMLGFERYCDSSGREYLRVPKSTKKALTRLDRTTGDGVDLFELVSKGDEPRRLFAKAWYSTDTAPGGKPREEEAPGKQGILHYIMRTKGAPPLRIKAD